MKAIFAFLNLWIANRYYKRAADATRRGHDHDRWAARLGYPRKGARA